MADLGPANRFAPLRAADTVKHKLLKGNNKELPSLQVILAWLLDSNQRAEAEQAVFLEVVPLGPPNVLMNRSPQG